MGTTNVEHPPRYIVLHDPGLSHSALVTLEFTIRELHAARQREEFRSLWRASRETVLVTAPEAILRAEVTSAEQKELLRMLSQFYRFASSLLTV